MRKDQPSIRQYGLYGEGRRAIEPEFIHIETILARSSLHGGVIGAHMHPAIFQILYLGAGSGWMATDGHEHPIPTPGVVVVPCGCTHYFRFGADAQGWVLSIADSLPDDARLAASGGAAIARGTEVFQLPLAPEGPEDALLSSLLAELARRHENAPGQLSGSTMAMIGVILTTIGELADAVPGSGGQAHNRRIELVRRFMQKLEAHYREHLTVAQFAFMLGTTTPTLTRACTEVAGQPPGRIALDRILREAMRSLSYTTASISEISDDLGFADPGYFARSFRKHCGLTASEFRRGRVRIPASEKNATFRS